MKNLETLSRRIKMANDSYNRLMEVDATPMVATSRPLPEGNGNPIAMRERTKQRTIALLEEFAAVDGHDTYVLCFRAAELRQTERTPGVTSQLVDVQLKLIHLLTDLQKRQKVLENEMKTSSWADIDVISVHQDLLQVETYISAIRKELGYV